MYLEQLELKIQVAASIILFVLLSNFIALAQNESDVLARIGSDKITVEEFQNRFDFMPHLNYSDSNIDSIKKEFLYSLIAEKLWALEANETLFDTIPVIKNSLKSLEKLFVKDELYKEKVESQINISADEIAAGLKRVTRVLNFYIIALSDSATVFNAYGSLTNGSAFDSIQVQLSIPIKVHSVKYGSLEDETLENILYLLKPGEFTHPYRSGVNWFIFKLVSDENDNSIDPSKEHARNIVLKKLKDRKSQKIGRAYLNTLFTGKKIEADRNLFNLISDNLLSVIKNRTGVSNIQMGSEIQLLETDIYKALKLINQSDINSPFIELDPYPATVSDFLFYAIYQKIYFASLDSLRFKQILSGVIKKFIEDEMIAREGYRLRLNNLSSVKHDIAIWRGYYLAEVIMNSFSDSIKITDQDVKDYLGTNITNEDGFMINIAEIFTPSLEDIEHVLDELKSGRDFLELSEKYNQREWTKRSKGIWGFFDPYKAGEIGRIALEMSVGEVYGPLKVKDGYSIFKLIDQKKNVPAENKVISADSLKFIKTKLALGKMDELINKKTVELANKYRVEIDPNLLSKVEVSPLNTFTYRLIGFGGKIAAFPITVPMYEWYKDYKIQKEIP